MLAQRFYDLKTKIGGNREKSNWEFTFGMPREIENRVTMPNAHIRRIIAQLEFALQLVPENAAVSESLSILEDAMTKDGVLTKDICLLAEKSLMPLQNVAKEYEILLVSHAHIDMNWMWGWQETVAATLSTFRTILALMREYKHFTFSQSQASVYKIVEDYDPSIMEEIKSRIKEGRWECTASAWVETDKNMPSTESLIRHISQTREYLQNTWGVESFEIDFSPDTFGHSKFIPEINAYGNVKYYYHCRGHESRHVLYRWLAPSGKEVLACNEPFWYNAAIVPEMGASVIELSNLSGGLKTGLFLYGVGNHGGGPTRKDIERAIEMQDYPVYPRLKFGTLQEYFHKAEEVRDKLPIWDNEINAIFTGCYTTQSRIKLGNRKAESALVSAENLYALSNIITDYSYSKKNINRAWQNVLFTHFHDILTGSTVQEAREHAMGLFADTMSIANTLRENATRSIAEIIDTSMIEVDTNICETQSEGAGVGYGISNYSGVPNPERGKGKVRIYNIFNPTPYERKELIEITVWDWQWDISRLIVTDHENKPLEFQLIDRHLQNYWDHKYIRVLVLAHVPQMGYKTIVIKEKEMEKYPVLYHGFPRNEAVHGPIVMENEYIYARFCYKTGALISLKHKKTDTEYVKESGGLVYVSAEAASNSAWLIGRHLGHKNIDKTLRISYSGGELRKTLTIEQRIESSRIKTTISLDKDAKALAYSYEINWEEYAKHDENVPVLIFKLPLAETPKSYQTDVPAGYIRREGKHQDVCGSQYGAAVYDNNSIAIISDCKYGYRGVDNELSVTLINSSRSPDLYPERGVHKINLWVAIENNNPYTLKKAADCFCYPMNYLSTGHHKGSLPATHSLMGFEAKSTVLSSIGTLDDGIYIRVYETCGENDTVNIKLPFKPKSACLVDLNGNKIGDINISDHTIIFNINPHCIVGIDIKR